MELADPYLLGAATLVLLPYLVMRGRAVLYADRALVGPRRGRHLLAWMPDGFFIAAALLLGIALARPQHVGETQWTQMQARDIILTLDLSSSMTFPMSAPQGVRIDRLQAARSAALNFVDQLEGDRVGLIVFGSSAFGLWPLSSDLAIVKRKLESIQGPIPREFDGTDIGKALLKSLAHFEELAQAQEKILVLLTDGIDTIRPEQRQEISLKMRTSGVKFYLLGIGLSPQSDVVRLAQTVHGRSFDVMQAWHMNEAFAEIAVLERSSIMVQTALSRRELFPMLAAASLICFFMALGLQKLWLVNPV